MKPRIMVFSTAYFPSVGGAEVAIKEITALLSEYDFDLITARLDPGLPRIEKIGATQVYRVGFGSAVDKLLLPVLGTLTALGLMRRNHYQLFWPVMVTFASGIPYIINILRFVFGYRKIPTVLTLQEGDSAEHIKKKRLGLIGFSWWLALSRTDHLTVISDYLRQQAIAYGYRGGVTTVPNGVAGYFFSTPETKLPLGSLAPKIIVTASRLVRKNGIDILIKALALLPEDYHLAIAGEGSEEANLRSLAGELGVEGRVNFAGYLKPEALPNFLRQGQVFARPSRSEGLGNAFLEAMAMRLPVIGTRVGGIPDVIKPGVTGWLCEPNNPNELAERISYVLDHNNQSEIMTVIETAYNMVATHYRWQTIVAEMKSIFHQYV